MAGTEALLFFIVVPIVAWAVEVLVVRGAYETASRDLASRGMPAPTRRMYVLLAYGAVPLVLALPLWLLSKPLTDQIDSGLTPGSAILQPLLAWAAITYGIAVIVTMIARASIVRARFIGLMGTDFGRVLPIWVIPFTGVIFGLVLGFLALGAVDNFVSGSTVFSSAEADAAVAALQAYAVSTLGFLAGALASNRVKDLSIQGFQRAVLFAVAGEVPALLGLVWAFLAIGKL